MTTNRGRTVIFLAALIVAVAAWQILKPKKPNIILISIDTLRADRLETMPNLRAFQSESIQFENAFASSSWTLPSHMSMFTGLYTFRHKVNNVSYLPLFEWKKIEAAPLGEQARRTVPLDFKIKTLPEYLRSAGYRTVSFVHSRDWYLDAALGFHRGIDEMQPLGLDTEEGLARITDWFSNAKERPVFAFIHSKLPHVPYIALGTVWKDRIQKSTEAPAPEAISTDQAIDAIIAHIHEPDFDRRILTTLVSSDLCYVVKGGMKKFSFRSLYCHEIGVLNGYAQLETYYNFNVRYADELLGKLLKRLKESGWLENSILIITSDHGEGFGQHGVVEHANSLFNELLHVPLAIRIPREKPRVEPKIAELIDLLPTLLGLTGLNLNDPVDGKNLFAPEGDQFAFAEGVDLEAQSLTSIQDLKWKLIVKQDGSRLLFDKAIDSAEQKDIHFEHQDIVERLELEILRKRVGR